MSWRHLNAVWAAHLEPAGMKLVAATLADRADDNGGGIRLSVATIARRASMGVRSTQRWLRGLEQRGVLVVEKRSTQHSPTHYRMPIEALHALTRPEADFHPDTDSEVTPATPLDDSRGATCDIQGCQSEHPGVTPVTPNPSLSRRKANSGRESGAAASDALARAAAAPLPDCVERQAWQELIDAWRDNLDADKVLAQAARYAADGRTKDEISAGIRSLAVNAHHKNLSLPRKVNGKASSKAPTTLDCSAIDYGAGLRP